MSANIGKAGERRGIRWRFVGWGLAAFMLLLPFLAMQVTSEVVWSPADFLVIGVMLAIAGGTVELAVRMSRDGYYRGGAGMAVLASFLLIWVNLAVGFLGDEGNPANLMFLGVLAVAIGGSIVARGRAAGMAQAMIAAAATQALVGVTGLAAGWASPGYQGLYEVTMGTTLFVTLWLVSAWLFGRAAERQAS